jgi:tetratricopeptide (TPR) repeat protein
VTELHDVPGRDGDFAELVEVCSSVCAQGDGGRVVFVAGSSSSGRGPLLRALAKQIAHTPGGPTVFAGRFADGLYVASDDDPAARARLFATLKRFGEAGEWIAGLLGDVGVPYAGLIAQVLARSDKPLALLDGLSARPQTFELAPRVLRLRCKQGPILCVVDDADQAHSGGVWADLILGLADRIIRSLPLVLILGVDGPEQLGDHQDDEADSLYVARALTGDGLASWHPLPPVGLKQLRRYTGRAAPEVVTSLLTITRGEPLLAGALWREWQRDGVVQDLSQTGWRFAAGSRDVMLDEVDEVLGTRLKQLVGDDLGDVAKLEFLARVRRVLVYGALEGRRFTAAAIANTLGIDPDDFIDFLDDTLTTGAKRPDGLLLEDGWVHVRDESGSRSLAMYRFTSMLDWLTLARHVPVDQQLVAKQLADALATLYEGQSYLIAHTLTRLYTLATLRDRAGHYQRMADTSTSREIILWRACSVLDGDEPTDRSSRRRASQILIAAANELFHTGPFSDGLKFAEAAFSLAPLRSDQAHALYLTATHRRRLGYHATVRTEFLAALELFRELGDRAGEAAARHSLADLDFDLGDYEKARTQCLAVLELHRQLGDRNSEAATRHVLANIDYEQGKYEKARTEYLAILKLRRQAGDRNGEAAVRHSLANIDRAQGKYEKARTEYLAILELRRQLGDRDGEALVRHSLANIDYEQGKYDKARTEYLAVLELHRQLGDRDGEVITRQSLANIDYEQGKYEKARTEYLAVLELRRQLGDRDGEATTRHALATIDARQGDYEKARTEYLAVLELRRQAGDRNGEAATRHALASIDYEQGKYEKARTEYLAVLELYRALGDRDGEATTRHALATIDRAQGNYEKARTEYLAVLELYRELGDRDGEATTRHALATIDARQGDYEKARTEYLAVLGLRRELGDRAGEATTRHALASIDYEQGKYEKARTEYLAVLELRRELGDRAGEAATRHALARIDRAQGKYEKARTEYLAVLGLRRELGDRAGEATTRHALASIDYEQGKYEKARTEYLAVLELHRQLGDRDGEADALGALARIDGPSDST